MVGGVLFNLILAVIIYASVLKVWGEEYLPLENMQYGVVAESTALDMGIQHGDKILSIDNQKIEKFTAITSHLLLNEAQTIQIERNGERIELAVPKEIIPRLIKGEPFLSPRFPFIIDEFAKESAGKAAGILPGDRVLGIDTLDTPFFDQFRSVVTNYKNKTTPVKVLRGSDTLSFEVSIPESGLIGARPNIDDVFELKVVEYGFIAAIPAGIKKAVKVGQDYLKQFKLLFNPETKAYESLGGFIAIGSIFPSVWDWQSFWNLTGFLSIMLAILNILPIPALDGGHVMFLMYEIITRRKPSEKFMEYAQMVGIFLLLALLLFANGNDVYKWINGLMQN
jgi:regulator of sigma E protease